MARTKNDLIAATLKQLRVLAVGETPRSEDADDVARMYDVKIAEWRRHGLIWWPNTDRTTAEIPDDVFSTIVDLMDNAIGGWFGNAVSVSDKRFIEKSLLQNLRRLNHKPPSGEVARFLIY